MNLMLRARVDRFAILLQCPVFHARFFESVTQEFFLNNDKFFNSYCNKLSCKEKEREAIY